MESCPNSQWNACCWNVPRRIINNFMIDGNSPPLRTWADPRIFLAARWIRSQKSTFSGHWPIVCAYRKYSNSSIDNLFPVHNLLNDICSRWTRSRGQKSEPEHSLAGHLIKELIETSSPASRAAKDGGQRGGEIMIIGVCFQQRTCVFLPSPIIPDWATESPLLAISISSSASSPRWNCLPRSIMMIA